MAPRAVGRAPTGMFEESGNGWTAVGAPDDEPAVNLGTLEEETAFTLWGREQRRAAALCGVG